MIGILDIEIIFYTERMITYKQQVYKKVTFHSFKKNKMRGSVMKRVTGINKFFFLLGGDT